MIKPPHIKSTTQSFIINRHNKTLRLFGEYVCVLRIAQCYVTNASSTQGNNRTHIVELVTLL